MRWHPNSPGFGFQADLVTHLLYMGTAYWKSPLSRENELPGNLMP